jgi:hypothetical protein
MKKILISLFVWFIWFISFCSASTYTIQWNVNNWFNPIMVVPQSFYSKSFSVHCVFSSENLNCQGWNAIQFWFKFAQIYNSTFLSSTLVDTNSSYSINCDNLSDIVIDYDFSTYTPWGWPYSKYYWVYFINFSSFWVSDWLDIPYSCTFVWNNILSAWSCPEVNTWEILSWYILESEIDTNYCVWNWLCPNECWSWTDFSWDLQYSNIYINSILHPWKQNIFIDIPDYITWDYFSTGDDFNLYVWSGYDVDYINSIIDINSYRPTSTDFTDIFVWWLTLITPYIVAVLFFYLVWRLLKRIFS